MDEINILDEINQSVSQLKEMDDLILVRNELQAALKLLQNAIRFQGDYNEKHQQSEN